MYSAREAHNLTGRAQLPTPQQIMPGEANDTAVNPQKSLSEISGIESNGKPYIPRSWTTLYHGTNLVKWQGVPTPFTSDKLITSRLWVISERDRERARANGMNDTATTERYTKILKPNGMSDKEFTISNKPFEIRIIFLDDPHYYNTEQGEKMVRKYGEDIMKQVETLYQVAYWSIDLRNTKLSKLMHLQENSKDVFYYIPEDFKDLWLKDVEEEKKLPKKLEE
ncbi:MAG: hypothetical protein HW400_942 [Candidatus Levybacteria bacterium]|nr:hypothetical protein [Candidatus Levybacteria bacterium]